MATGKRKHEDISTNTSNTSPNGASSGTQKFRLLDLAAKLRNNIYEKVLEGAVIWIKTKPAISHKTNKRNKKDKPTIEWRKLLRLPQVLSSLALLNKQVYQEVLYVALTAVPLHTEAVHFDFSHVVTFLNKLGDIELDHLALRDRSQEMHIWLLGGHYDKSEFRRHFMVRWLKRMEVSTKKGTKIDFRYHAEPVYTIGSVEDTFAWNVWRLRQLSEMSHSMTVVLQDGPKTSRFQQEGRKILEVLQQG